MSPVALLLLGLLAVREEPERDELVRRGYELLPNARWIEELERDRSRSFLGVPTSTPSSLMAARGTFVVDYMRLDYDPRALHPEEVPFAGDPSAPPAVLPLSKRERRIWNLATHGISAFFPVPFWDGLVPPVKALQSAK